MWIIVGMTVLRGALTLPGAVLSMMLGRLPGLVVRYAFGVEDRRAHGNRPRARLRRAGIDAARGGAHGPRARGERLDDRDRYPAGLHRAGARDALSQAGVLPEIDDDHTNPLTADPEPSDDVGEPDGVATALLPEETATITRADDVDLTAVLAEASSAH